MNALIRLPILALTAAAAIGMLTALTGCEDEPSSDDLDSFFSSNPTISDPRTQPGVSTVRISPASAVAASVGQKIMFKAGGGTAPYHWGISITSRGSIDRSESTTASAVYTVTTVGPNNVIVYDAQGAAAIASITTDGTANPLKIVPADVTLATNHTVQFTAVGGVKPYGTWQVSKANLGTINAAGLYTPTGIGLSANSENIITLTDAEGMIAQAKVTHQSAGGSGSTIRIIPDQSELHSGGAATIDLSVIGGAAPYTWATAFSSIGILNTAVGANVQYTPLAVGTNIVTVTDGNQSIDSITIIKP